MRKCCNKRCGGRYPSRKVEKWVEGVRQSERRAWSWRYSPFEAIQTSPLNNHANQVHPVKTSNFFNSSALSFLLFKRLNWFPTFISWTKPQVQARSHPNLLAATVWLNNLYHVQDLEINEDDKLANTMKGVDLNTPLTYADRFRIRKPGFQWDFHPPHVDGAFRISRIILFLF